MSDEAIQHDSLADDESIPLPPPSFEFLTLSFKTQAEMHMGLIHFGDENDRTKPNKRLARHTIDMLSMLQAKTKGNLSLDEQRLIDNSLTELRFRFVQQFNESKP